MVVNRNWTEENIMSSAAEELEAVVLALPRGERARLAERLLASLDEETEIDEAWAEEIEARLEAYRRGELESLPVDEVIRHVREELGKKK